MRKFTDTFYHNRYYHVFNRTNNKEKLFKQRKNKTYFLNLINDKLTGYVKIYAYALLGTHFHLLISVRNEEEIIHHVQNLPKVKRKKVDFTYLEATKEARDINQLVIGQFAGLFNSYSQAINKAYKRDGNLFHKTFKRVEVKFQSKFSWLIYYHHHNSRHHNLIQDFLKDPWHSYHEIISNEESFLEREFVLDWFGGKEDFIKYHQRRILDRDYKNLAEIE